MVQTRSRLKNVLKKFLDISSLRLVSVVKFASDSVTEYGIDKSSVHRLRGAGAECDMCECDTDIGAMDACDAAELCVPIIDTLLANTHYAVLSFSQPDLREICS